MNFRCPILPPESCRDDCGGAAASSTPLARGAKRCSVPCLDGISRVAGLVEVAARGPVLRQSVGEAAEFVTSGTKRTPMMVRCDSSPDGDFWMSISSWV